MKKWPKRTKIKSRGRKNSIEVCREDCYKIFNIRKNCSICGICQMLWIFYYACFSHSKWTFSHLILSFNLYDFLSDCVNFRPYKTWTGPQKESLRLSGDPVRVHWAAARERRDGGDTRAHRVASGEDSFQPEGQRRETCESISTQQRGALWLWAQEAGGARPGDEEGLLVYEELKQWRTTGECRQEIGRCRLGGGCLYPSRVCHLQLWFILPFSFFLISVYTSLLTFLLKLAVNSGKDFPCAPSSLCCACQFFIFP